MGLSTLVDRVRQPEYTGENRCTPCTIVNVAIAAVVSVALGLLWAPLVVASFALFVAVIYTRGYLVPGTPTLTKRYFPDRVLRWFDKEPQPAFTVGLGDGTAIDVEAVLQETEALEPCEDVEDLCLTPEFESAWRREIERTDDPLVRQRLAAIVGVDESALQLDDIGGWYTATVETTQLGRWESQAALVADLAADAVLASRVLDWNELGPDQRSALVRGLRIYLEECPDCGGTVSFGEETRESCCRSWETLVTRCNDCGTRLFEVEASLIEEDPHAV
ncbi:hypothetical protein [Haloferax sp. YSSS75]|uniref:hypothetical protein n=1 Tax=Haloferax sp. YSSS75 TaxID=3388564 RepID=UPI00398C9920